jgi:hypothetical protein
VVFNAAFSTEEPLVHVGQGDGGSGTNFRTKATLNAFSYELRLRLSVHIGDIQDFFRAHPNAGATSSTQSSVDYPFLELIEPDAHSNPPSSFYTVLKYIKN